MGTPNTYLFLPRLFLITLPFFCTMRILVIKCAPFFQLYLFVCITDIILPFFTSKCEEKNHPFSWCNFIQVFPISINSSSLIFYYPLTSCIVIFSYLLLRNCLYSCKSWNCQRILVVEYKWKVLEGEVDKYGVPKHFSNFSPSFYIYSVRILCWQDIGVRPIDRT